MGLNQAGKGANIDIDVQEEKLTFACGNFSCTTYTHGFNSGLDKFASYRFGFDHEVLGSALYSLFAASSC